MAAAAVYKLQIFASGVTALFRVQITVAIDACHVGMNGCCVFLCGHEDRHLLAAAGARELAVVVTVEAFLIVLRQRWGCREAKDRGRYDEATPSMTALGKSRVRRTLTCTQEDSR